VGQTTGLQCGLPVWPSGSGGSEFESQTKLQFVGLCRLVSIHIQRLIFQAGKEGLPVSS